MRLYNKYTFPNGNRISDSIHKQMVKSKKGVLDLWDAFFSVFVASRRHPFATKTPR